MEEEQTVMDYINMLAPDHDRTGCEDPHSHSAAFQIDGRVYNKCNRCTLLRIAELARSEQTDSAINCKNCPPRTTP